MSQGQDQVQAALAICRNVSAGLDRLSAGEGEWADIAAARVRRVEALLEGITDKFFLRMKVCVPFTARCEREARRLEEALGPLETSHGEAAQRDFEAALAGLEKSAKTLEARSAMRGMAIT